ncbi:hypothetical protein NKG05_21540 [Oerskovia sp. M15]
MCWERWDVVEQSASAVTLELHLVPTPGYPFDLVARVTYALSDAGLRVTTRATNVGSTDAPYGVGFHPGSPRRRTARRVHPAPGREHAGHHGRAPPADGHRARRRRLRPARTSPARRDRPRRRLRRRPARRGRPLLDAPDRTRRPHCRGVDGRLDGHLAGLHGRSRLGPRLPPGRGGRRAHELHRGRLPHG